MNQSPSTPSSRLSSGFSVQGGLAVASSFPGCGQCRRATFLHLTPTPHPTPASPSSASCLPLMLTSKEMEGKLWGSERPDLSWEPERRSLRLPYFPHPWNCVSSKAWASLTPLSAAAGERPLNNPRSYSLKARIPKGLFLSGERNKRNPLL